MRFSYSGQLNGRAVDGAVAEGRITGNPFVAIRVEALVDGEMRVGWGPVTGPASLTEPTLARATVAAVLDEGSARFDGDETPVMVNSGNGDIQEAAGKADFNPYEHPRNRRGEFRDKPTTKTPRQARPRGLRSRRGGKSLRPPKPPLVKVPKRDGTPPVLPWQDPPPPRGRKGQRKAGGFTATGETNTKLGDLAEKVVQQLAMESLLPPGKRQNPLDVKWDGSNYGFEVKAMTTAAQPPYKVKMKVTEVESKRRYAEENNMVGGVCIVVMDADSGQAWVYWKEGIANGRLNAETWNFMGVARIE